MDVCHLLPPPTLPPLQRTRFVFFSLSHYFFTPEFISVYFTRKHCKHANWPSYIEICMNFATTQNRYLNIPCDICFAFSNKGAKKRNSPWHAEADKIIQVTPRRRMISIFCDVRTKTNKLKMSAKKKSHSNQLNRSR